MNILKGSGTPNKPPILSVNNMAQVGASQLTGTDIRVNTICPGLIEV